MPHARSASSRSKADQVCALEPERERDARAIVHRGFTKSYDYAPRTMKDVPYGKGKIIAQGTDWRFLNELKKELKG